MEHDIQWRVTGSYMAFNVLKPSFLHETRQFLLSYAATGSFTHTAQELLNETLLQRSRETRKLVVKVIQRRLTSWNPPAWVSSDLIEFAQDTFNPSLQTALLLHVVRQDALLYDVVQTAIVPRWLAGDHILIRADVQRFLDLAAPDHPEVETWSHTTREKLAGNVLSILRDYTLLRGKEKKQIVEPIVPAPVATHLVRLLRAEGVADDAIPDHPDWRIWLWDAQRARDALRRLAALEAAR